MRYEININYKGLPKALITFMGKKGDIYPFLPPSYKKRINRSYDETIDLNVSDKSIREAFPVEWKNMLKAKRVARKLPPHLTNFR